MPSLGSNRTAVYNADGTVKEFVTTYSVYNNGVSTPFNTYQEAADYMNSIGGSAMSNSQLQSAVRQSGGAVTAVYEDGKQVDLQTGNVQNEVLLDQNKANSTGLSANPVDPATDPDTPQGTVTVIGLPAEQEFGNTDGYGAQNDIAVPTADIQTSATPVTPSPASGQIAYDDEGNLLPGWTVDEGNTPIFLGGDFVDPATQALADQGRADAANARSGEVQVGANAARNQQPNADLGQATFPQNNDWRVTLRLAPNADYLYKAGYTKTNPNGPGILAPLAVTNGVVFPYTPNITTAYKANYTPYDLVHSNYRGYFYSNSYIDQITVNATFTAQSTSDAQYVLAVIHFFRSVTKMFYGQDAQRGSPPPLVFLSGLGDFQFNNHPCLVSQFNYNLPADVDYVSSGTPNNLGLNLAPLQNLYSTTINSFGPTAQRLAQAFLPPGAQNALPAPLQQLLLSNPSYVPSKIDIQLTLLPVQTRRQVSQVFSLKDFASGQLLRKGFW